MLIPVLEVIMHGFIDGHFTFAHYGSVYFLEVSVSAVHVAYYYTSSEITISFFFCLIFLIPINQ